MESRQETVLKNVIYDSEWLFHKYWLQQSKYEGWNFNSGNYLFTTDTK